MNPRVDLHVTSHNNENAERETDLQQLSDDNQASAYKTAFPVSFRIKARAVELFRSPSFSSCPADNPTSPNIEFGNRDIATHMNLDSKSRGKCRKSGRSKLQSTLSLLRTLN